MTKERIERDWSRQEEWGWLHMATCSCRLRVEDYISFRKLCASYGLTAHAALRLIVGILLWKNGAKMTLPLRAAVCEKTHTSKSILHFEEEVEEILEKFAVLVDG